MQEARRRVAESGNGNPALLRNMIERVKTEMEMQDNAPINRRNMESGDVPRMPSNLDSYIDKVLQMSGMVEGGGAPAAGANVPAPTPRPDQRPELPTREGPDDSMNDSAMAQNMIAAQGAGEDGTGSYDELPEITPEQIAELDETQPTGSLLKTLGITGGGLGAVLALLYAFNKAKGTPSNVDQTIAATTDGGETAKQDKPQPNNLDKRMGGPVDVPQIPKLDGSVNTAETMLKHALSLPPAEGIEFLRQAGFDIDSPAIPDVWKNAPGVQEYMRNLIKKAGRPRL